MKKMDSYLKDESGDGSKDENLNDSPPLTVGEGRRGNFDLR